MERTKKSRKKKNFNKKTIGRAALMVLWVGVACFASQFIIGYPMLWILGKATYQTPVWTTIYGALVYILAAFLVIVVPKFVKKEWKTNRDELGLTELPTFTDIGLSFLGFIATILISGAVLYILQKLNLVDSSQAQNVGYSNLTLPFDRIVAFLALAVIAPVAASRLPPRGL